MGVIVVGIDGSEGSVEALRFALAEARLRGVELKAVGGWHVPPAAYGSGWAPAPNDIDEFRKLAQIAVDKSLEEAGAAGSGVAVTSVLREGQAADVLCDEAGRDDLIVVGTRGLGSVKGLLLGSVSQQVLHNAPCPVVVVPRHEDGRAGGDN
jgi:nucleotide-binding universal stress UspA family protein